MEGGEGGRGALFKITAFFVWALLGRGHGAEYFRTKFSAASEVVGTNAKGKDTGGTAS